MSTKTYIVETAKQRMLDLINALPDNATSREILQEVAFQQAIDEGMEDSEAGRVISTEELREKVKKWLQ
ncbi:MAG: hypothetical protein L3J82_01390 [Planctomycetes bacterium]|nr:hypothetical protein [Planctomycetota bacterium]